MVFIMDFTLLLSITLILLVQIQVSSGGESEQITVIETMHNSRRTNFAAAEAPNEFTNLDIFDCDYSSDKDKTTCSMVQVKVEDIIDSGASKLLFLLLLISLLSSSVINCCHLSFFLRFYSCYRGKFSRGLCPGSIDIYSHQYCTYFLFFSLPF